MNLTDKQIEQYKNEERNAVEYVSKLGWSFSNFKRFISQFLLTNNDEEQWVFDYQSYADNAYNNRIPPHKIHPSKWAREFYGDRWDKKKFNKAIESLKNTAKNEQNKF